MYFLQFLICKIKVTLLPTAWGHVENSLSNAHNVPSKKWVVINFTYNLEAMFTNKCKTQVNNKRNLYK